MNAEMIEKLKKLAAKQVWVDSEDFDAAESSGYDYDEAYYAGYQSGEVVLAREILNTLGVEW